MVKSDSTLLCNWVQNLNPAPIEKLETVGVLLTRTNQPYRAIDTIRQFAFAEGMEFKLWSVLRGWETYNRAQPDAAPTSDAIAEPVQAVKAIGSDAGQGFPAPGMYVMFYAHPYVKQIAPFIQQVKEYCRVFPQTKKRLVILTPPGFTLPTELENDVTVLDFDPPSYSELTSTYRDILGSLPPAKQPKVGQDGMERILSAGVGLTAHEAETALARALVSHRQRLPNITPDDLAQEIMNTKIEAVKKTEVLEIMAPEDMSNVGGLHNLKDWVAKRAMAYTDEARAFGIEAPKGIVLAGPPGICSSRDTSAASGGMPAHVRYPGPISGRGFRQSTGKAGQPPGSRILMADNVWLEIEALAVGDEVISPQPDGTCRTAIVTEITEIPDAPIFEVSTTGRGGRRSYRCGSHHRIPYFAVQRVPGDRIKKRSLLLDSSAEHFVARGEQHKSKARVFTCPAIDLSTTRFAIHPYVMGVMIGNGSLSQAIRETGGSGQVAVTIRDEPVIEKAKQFGMTISTMAWRSGAWSIQLTGLLRDALRESCIAGSRSHDKLVPEEYFSSSIEQRLWLLAGLIDTDGTREEFSSVSEQLALDFIDLVHSVGGVAKSASRYTTCNGKCFPSYRVSYSTAEYQIPVQCDRKRRKGRDMGWKNPRNTSFNVTDVGRSDLLRIRLSPGHGWYVTDDWLVTRAFS